MLVCAYFCKNVYAVFVCGGQTQCVNLMALQRARIEREMMIEEQDQRYRQSLEADRMKEVKRVEAERQMLQKQENEIVSVKEKREKCSNTDKLPSKWV